VSTLNCEIQLSNEQRYATHTYIHRHKATSHYIMTTAEHNMTQKHIFPEKFHDISLNSMAYHGKLLLFLH